jgi:ribosome-associated toxin RatA of RatAB toxin-antitoxin module
MLAGIFCAVTAAAAAAECPRTGPVSEAAFTVQLDAAELLARARREAIVVEQRTLTRCDGTRALAISGAALLEAPPGAVWSVLTDFESWPRFVPHLEHVGLEATDSGSRVTLYQRMRLFGMAFEYTTQRRLEPERGLMWVTLDHSRPHDLGDVAGLWQVIPVDGGARTLLCFQSYVEANRMLPGFVERSLVQKSVPRSLAAFAGEVASRQGTLSAQP